MKKFTILLAALLIGGLCFGQKAIRTLAPMVKANVSAVSEDRAAWYGSSDERYIMTTEANDVYYILGSVAGAPTTAGNSVAKVRFGLANGADYVAYNAGYATYVGTSFTIQIYAVDDVTAFDPATASPAYTEDYTATFNVSNEVTFAVPYEITGDYLIGIKANAPALLLGDQVEISDAVTADQEPVVTGTWDYRYYSNSANGFGPMSGVYYTDETQAEIQALNVTTSFEFYIEDGNAYEPVYDVAAYFLAVDGNSITSIYEDGQDVTVAAGESLPSIVPAARSVGTDLTTDSTDIFVTIMGEELEIGAGLLGTLYSVWNVDATTMLSLGYYETALGIELSGEVCLEARLRAGNIDSNAANNRTCINIIRETTSVNENLAGELSVYPNPANDMITVANAEGETVVVMNALGQVVANIENADANQVISTENFAAGTYFVKVNAEVVKLNVVK